MRSNQNVEKTKSHDFLASNILKVKEKENDRIHDQSLEV